jgi:hypothetical protein
VDSSVTGNLVKVKAPRDSIYPSSKLGKSVMGKSNFSVEDRKQILGALEVFKRFIKPLLRTSIVQGIFNEIFKVQKSWILNIDPQHLAFCLKADYLLFKNKTLIGTITPAIPTKPFF